MSAPGTNTSDGDRGECRDGARQERRDGAGRVRGARARRLRCVRSGRARRDYFGALRRRRRRASRRWRPARHRRRLRRGAPPAARAQGCTSSSCAPTARWRCASCRSDLTMTSPSTSRSERARALQRKECLDDDDAQPDLAGRGFERIAWSCNHLRAGRAGPPDQARARRRGELPRGQGEPDAGGRGGRGALEAGQSDPAGRSHRHRGEVARRAAAR